MRVFRCTYSRVWSKMRSIRCLRGTVWSFVFTAVAIKLDARARMAAPCFPAHIRRFDVGVNTIINMDASRPYKPRVRFICKERVHHMVRHDELLAQPRTSREWLHNSSHGKRPTARASMPPLSRHPAWFPKNVWHQAVVGHGCPQCPRLPWPQTSCCAHIAWCYEARPLQHWQQHCKQPRNPSLLPNSSQHLPEAIQGCSASTEFTWHCWRGTISSGAQKRISRGSS